MSDRSKRAAILTFAAALTLWGSSAALAHHSTDHAGGPPAGSGGPSEQPTEDTDPDGVPNAPDPQGDSDNQHPSGNDKHVEPGGSGNMGWASSEPDQNTSGPERDVEGRDHPGGPGGADKLDQDGNNGCGNDDDFEDDNEGLCGGESGPKPPPPPPPPLCCEPPPPPCCEAGENGVLGETVGGAGVAARGEPVQAGDEQLAFTGPSAAVVPLGVTAVWLAAAGSILLLLGRWRGAR